MILRLAALISLLILPGLSWAQEFVTVPRRLSDEAFYRLVACGAPPGGDCRKPLIRWPERRAVSLTVGIVQIDAGFPGYKLDLVEVDKRVPLLDRLKAASASLEVDQRPIAVSAPSPGSSIRIDKRRPTKRCIRSRAISA